MQPQSQRCDICQTNILAKCLDIHRRACEKKNKKNATKVPIPIDTKDLIPCSECGEMVSFFAYQSHLDECVGRQLTKCHQCKLLYPTFLIEEHLNVCDTYNEQPVQKHSPIKVNNPPAMQEGYDMDFQEQLSEDEHDQQMHQMIQQLARQVPVNDDPLNMKQINKITQTAIYKSQDCSICYMKVFPKSMVLRLPCPHLYHIKCISTWLQKNPRCPMCRKHAITGK